MLPNESLVESQSPYLLSCEDPAEFAEFCRGLDESHQPANAHERILVEEFANAAWELRRVRRIDREFWECVAGHYQGGEAGIAEALAQEKESRFRIHLRLRAQVERSYYRALAALERMHRDRNRRPVTAVPQEPLPAPRKAASPRQVSAKARVKRLRAVAPIPDLEPGEAGPAREQNESPNFSADP